MKLVHYFILFSLFLSLVLSIQLKTYTTLQDEKGDKDKKDGNAKAEPPAADKKPEERDDERREEEGAGKKDGAKREKGGNKKDDAKKEEGKKDEKKAGDDLIVSAFPFKISKCTQVLYYEGKTLSNPNDFATQDKPAFFTLSAFMVNAFGQKNSNLLLESINLAHINVYPKRLQGTKSCIFFEDHGSTRNITMCLKEEKEIQAILDAYKVFLDCRGGRDLTKSEKTLVLKASTTGVMKPDGTMFDLGQVQSIFKEELEKNGLKVKQHSLTVKQLESVKEDSEAYYEMKKLVVPGSA